MNEEIDDYETLGVPYRKPVAQWTADKVAGWLGKALGLEAAAPAFRARDVDGSLLLGLDEAMLRDDLQMASGLDRLKVLTKRDQLPELRAAPRARTT